MRGHNLQEEVLLLLSDGEGRIENIIASHLLIDNEHRRDLAIAIAILVKQKKIHCTKVDDYRVYWMEEVMKCLGCFGSGKIREGVGIVAPRDCRLVRCYRCKGSGVEPHDAPKVDAA